MMVRHSTDAVIRRRSMASPYMTLLVVLVAACGIGAETATPAPDIRVLDGFEVELVYSVPLEAQGSWVCMTTDPRGRLICSDQRGGLYRLTLEKGGEAPVPRNEAERDAQYRNAARGPGPWEG